MEVAVTELSLSSDVGVDALPGEARILVAAAGVAVLGLICSFGLWCTVSAETVFQIVTALE
jgi:hypothetical protein